MTKQERAVRTRHSLIRSAAEAFERHGYVQAKLADISAGAGVSPGALHFHFENKAAMASTVEAAAGVSLRREAWLAQRPDMNALQRLTNISHALAARLRRDVVARAGFQLSYEVPRPTGHSLHQEWQLCVRQLLAEAADEDLLADRAGQAGAVAVIVAATTGFELLGREDPAWFSTAALTAFWQLFLPCLALPEVCRTLKPGGAPAAPRGVGARAGGARRS
ncbi:ScbR family autoregulator-binding transcription factor [Dermacoccus nishinomiyaensis]|uniref:ScbR family autoregulator-binding transcription factor n=1 Tax=Dermacoccus nishinomiyaensis TaxID=1274 RepID=UPI0033B23B59